MSEYITHTTTSKREQLKKMLDKFSTFTWNGKSSWDFGAFIINENREGLKFYNGPSFSNEYTSPQFARNNEFIGVNFEQQKISFKIGVYWISIEDYRKFLEWLSPYVISKLGFTFAEKWYYSVKLTGREESTRYILGYETTNNGSEPRYYSEMTLNFEVQGEPCLYSVHELKWELQSDSKYHLNLTPNQNWPISSDLPADFQIDITCHPLKSTGSLEALIWYNSESKTLFNIQFKNLTYDPNVNNHGYDFNISYSSKDGLVYLAFAGEKSRLLNMLTTTTSGKEFIESLQVNKLQIPGTLTHPNLDYSNLTIQLTPTNLKIDDNLIDDVDMNVQIHSRARTNII